MKANKIILFLDNETCLLQDEQEQFFIRKGTLTLALKDERALLFLLPFFEKPFGSENEFGEKIVNSVRQAIPFDRLIIFLLTKMQTPYWIDLVSAFIIKNGLTDLLPKSTKDIVSSQIENKKWPQKTRHLLMKVLQYKNS